jgi:hypothetical protein
VARSSQEFAQSGCTRLSGGAPDSVRCARLALANWLLSGLRRWSTAKIHRTVRWCTGLSGEPIVGRANGRPRNPRATRGKCQRSDGAPDCPVCTGQCPVRQATEGKNCLPGMHSTTPSCLGAIKGTPRRMEEDTNHSLSIPKHQDFNSAHLILCDSN